jgi:carbonic anhydrase
LGHAGCGAVKAAIERKIAPGQIGSLYPYIQPAVDQAGPNLSATTKANAKIQAESVRNAVAEIVKENMPKVIPAYYDLATGAVTLLERQSG